MPYWDSAAAQGRENKLQVPLFWGWFLKWGEGRDGLGGLSASLVVLCAGIVSRTLLLLQAPQSGSLFWSFGVLLFTVCPKCSYTQLFLVPYSFFIFCCLRRHLCRFKHCSKGFQVPVPSLFINKQFRAFKRFYCC